MRFLTAYFAVSEGEVILTGSQRMQERPIKVLVEALEQLGLKLRMKGVGYPPIRIIGKKSPIK
jgi:3-phosphoshikimate 1-carboxyvinyltransferase